MIVKWSLAVAFLVCTAAPQASAQVAPSAAEVVNYVGLHAAAAGGNAAATITIINASPGALEQRDAHGRTALHVAAHFGYHEVMRILAKAGADANALDSQDYDIVTIAAVADDVPTLTVALEIGCRAGNITSPWRGTALIAAAHEGNAEVIRTLIKAGAPLDHVNSLGWTAMIEAVVLGDGGKRHQQSLRYLVEAGANGTLADPQGRTPLDLARERGYSEMIEILGEA